MAVSAVCDGQASSAAADVSRGRSAAGGSSPPAGGGWRSAH